jgi:hypothetical protein
MAKRQRLFVLDRGPPHNNIQQKETKIQLCDLPTELFENIVGWLEIIVNTISVKSDVFICKHWEKMWLSMVDQGSINIKFYNYDALRIDIKRLTRLSGLIVSVPHHYRSFAILDNIINHFHNEDIKITCLKVEFQHPHSRPNYQESKFLSNIEDVITKSKNSFLTLQRFACDSYTPDSKTILCEKCHKFKQWNVCNEAGEKKSRRTRCEATTFICEACTHENAEMLFDYYATCRLCKSLVHKRCLDQRSLVCKNCENCNSCTKMLKMDVAGSMFKCRCKRWNCPECTVTIITRQQGLQDRVYYTCKTCRPDLDDIDN